MKYGIEIVKGIKNIDGGIDESVTLDDFILENIDIEDARDNVASALLEAARENKCIAIANIYDAPLHQVGSWCASYIDTVESIDTWWNGKASCNNEWSEPF